jgi:hypothetical protein
LQPAVLTSPIISARVEQQSRESAAAERAIEEGNLALSAAEAAVAEIADTRATRLSQVNNLEADLRARRKA